MATRLQCSFFSSLLHSFSVFPFLLLLLLNGKASGDCDLFSGTWVQDQSYPLYDPATCPFLEHEFTCQKNGRPDLIYPHFRWQPLACGLVRLDGRDLLERLRGKSVMFVGDSLSLNQWQSLTCILHSAVPTSNYTLTRAGVVSNFTFTEYGVNLLLHRSAYLVDIVQENDGRVLKLDSVEGGSKLWTNIDYLIFNTWHWWYRRGPKQPWDYIEVDHQIIKDMDRMKAYETALTTWADWVDTNVDPTKVEVFFQGTSPSHYNGSSWNEPSAKGCSGQTTPVAGSTESVGLPRALTVLKGVLSKMKKPVTLLDITALSQLRKDGHPSMYGMGGPTGMDCTHWCLAGVPDTWNEIFYNIILSSNNNNNNNNA